VVERIHSTVAEPIDGRCKRGDEERHDRTSGEFVGFGVMILREVYF
jgi:hypothetical protein